MDIFPSCLPLEDVVISLYNKFEFKMNNATMTKKKLIKYSVSYLPFYNIFTFLAIAGKVVLTYICWNFNHISMKHSISN